MPIGPLPPRIERVHDHERWSESHRGICRRRHIDLGASLPIAYFWRAPEAGARFADIPLISSTPPLRAVGSLVWWIGGPIGPLRCVQGPGASYHRRAYGASWSVTLGSIHTLNPNSSGPVKGGRSHVWWNKGQIECPLYVKGQSASSHRTALAPT